MGDKCDQEVFDQGDSVAVLDACMHVAEEWVQKVAKASGQKVDWHYSGGVANVLYLGDHARVLAAVERLRPELERERPKTAEHSCQCEGDTHSAGEVLRVYGSGAHGPYRAGDPLPDGSIGVDTH